MEVWKNIKGYEGLYQVSSEGRIKSLERTVIYNNGRVDLIKERILKPSLASSGYLTVSLSKDGKQKTNSIHVLVSIAFHNHIPNGHESVINHIDFCKTNNKVDNLEVITQRQNTNKKHLRSSSQFTGVYWHKHTRKWRANITINGKLKYLGVFKTELEAHAAYKNELETNKLILA